MVKVTEGWRSFTKADLVELLNFVTKNQLFQFEGNLYEQLDDVSKALSNPFAYILISQSLQA